MAAPHSQNSSSPVQTTESRSQAEIQKLLRNEIDALRKGLDERFSEIAALTRRLEELGTGLSQEAEARLAQQEKRHRVQITLLHALYASWHKGPAAGVVSFAQQVAMLEGSDLFDATWYLKAYPDVSTSGFSPKEHYVRSGAFEGRNPGPKFDSMAYYLANSDVAQAGWPALVHYVAFGKAEGRPIG